MILFINLEFFKSNIKWGITKSCDHLRPAATSHNFAATTHDHRRQAKFYRHHPRPAIISPSPPTTTHNQPLFHRHLPQPRTTNMIKSPLPTNNDSLATTFLAITNSELYFSHHYSPSRIPRAV